MKGYVKDVSLFQHRHYMPESVQDAIYSTSIDPINVAKAESLAMTKMEALVKDGVVGINLYTTGLTMALLAALNAAAKCGIEVKVWHFYISKNGVKGAYEFFPQVMYTNKEGPTLMIETPIDRELQAEALKNRASKEDLDKWNKIVVTKLQKKRSLIGVKRLQQRNQLKRK